MRIAAFPLWVTLPVSGGIAAMSAFIPDLEPWQRWLGFSVGLTLFAWGVIGAIWHVWRERKKPTVAVQLDAPSLPRSGPRIPREPRLSVEDLRSLLDEPRGVPFPKVSQPPRFDMTLNQLVRRVAFESYWAADFNPDTPGEQWQKTFWWKPLKKEIFRGLVGGDLPARGILHRKNEEPDVGPTPIPIEFWRRADFNPELMLVEPTINDAVNGDRGEIYTDIEVRSGEVNRLWRARTGKSLEEKPSPFIAWHKEWWEQQEDIRLNHQMRMQEQWQRDRLAKEAGNDEQPE